MTVRQRLEGAALRWRYALLAVWTLGWSIRQARTWSPYDFAFSDWTMFQIGSRILRGHANLDPGPGGALHLYANLPKMQIGPPALLAAMPADLLPAPASVYAAVVVMAAAGLLLVHLVERLGRTLHPERDLRPLVLAGGLLVVPAWSTIAAQYLHLDDVLLLVLVAGAMLAIARERWVLAAVLLGVAVAAKPWAVFLLPVVWGLPRVRRGPAVLVVLAVAGLFWSPFLLAAPDTVQALGGVRLPVSVDSGLRVLGAGPGEAPAWLRALQTLLAVGAALEVARRGSWVAVPLAAVAVRVGLDPATYAYYGGGLVVAAFLWDVGRGRAWPRATAAASVVVLVPILLVELSESGIGATAAGWVRLLGCAALVAAALLAAVSTSRTQAVPDGVADGAADGVADRAAVSPSSRESASRP